MLLAYPQTWDRSPSRYIGCPYVAKTGKNKGNRCGTVGCEKHQVYDATQEAHRVAHMARYTAWEAQHTADKAMWRGLSDEERRLWCPPGTDHDRQALAVKEGSLGFSDWQTARYDTEDSHHHRKNMRASLRFHCDFIAISLRFSIPPGAACGVLQVSA